MSLTHSTDRMMSNLKNSGIVLLIWFIKVIATNQLCSELDTCTTRLSEGPFIISGICSKQHQHYMFLIPQLYILLAFIKQKLACQHLCEPVNSKESELAVLGVKSKSSQRQCRQTHISHAAAHQVSPLVTDGFFQKIVNGDNPDNPTSRVKRKGI